MRTLKMALLSVGALALLAGAARGALGLAAWNSYRSDLIRCTDAAEFGLDACGEEFGSDPLRKGNVMMNSKRITAQLIGAAPESLYFVEFIPLENEGEDSGGPYAGQDPLFIGTIETNRLGTGTMRTDNTEIRGPQLGYFLISSLELLGPLSSDQISAQSNGDQSQFVTGFDPEWVERED